MVQNIFVGLLGVAVVAAGIWGWWIENGRPVQEDDTDGSEAERMEETRNEDVQTAAALSKQMQEFPDSENKKVI